MRGLLPAAFAAVALLPAAVLAKGEGVGLWMEGQVSEVRAEGQNIRLVVTGGSGSSNIAALSLRSSR
ncbi:MAG: hypothetical protein E6H57_04750 [Betaproteobacteria bacterium]|nr:MAG: hypothetical protein E6H57_04750 [Betaproteobacteria bacterium]